MGEYERTYKQIEMVKKEIETIENQINELMERKEYLSNELGELFGYIAELEYIDGK